MSQKDNNPVDKKPLPNRDNEQTKRKERRSVLKGVAVGGVLAGSQVDRWVKPVVQSVVLPAHAQMSPGGESEPPESETPPTCEVGTTLFNDSDEDTVCIAVTPEQGTPGACAIDETISGSLDLPPGTYTVVVTVQLATGQNTEDFEVTVSCCSGDSTVVTGVYSRSDTAADPSSSSFNVADVIIDDDGECSIAT